MEFSIFKQTVFKTVAKSYHIRLFTVLLILLAIDCIYNDCSFKLKQIIIRIIINENINNILSPSDASTTRSDGGTICMYVLVYFDCPVYSIFFYSFFFLLNFSWLQSPYLSISNSSSTLYSHFIFNFLLIVDIQLFVSRISFRGHVI